MKVLIVKLSPIEAITSSMFRTLAVAHGLLEQGHEIDMLVVPMGPNSTKSAGFDFVNEINVIRTKSSTAYTSVVGNTAKNSGWKSLRKNVLRKLWHTFSIYDYTYTIATKVSIDILPRTDYDLVISSSDPKSSHVAVQQLIKQGLHYKKWIQYWGDPLAIDITQKSIYPKGILKIFETKLIDGCDKIIYVSPFTLAEQQRLFPEYADKMKFVPVAYIKEDVYPETHNDKYTIGYYGSYTSRVRNIMPFYDACKQLGDDIEASIYGDSDISLEPTENIKIYPRGIVDEHKKKTDLIVCILNSSGTQIPGKIYHMAGTNKQVLVVADGENRDKVRVYLDSFHRFEVCNNETDEIVHAIRRIMNDRGTRVPCPELRYDAITKRFIDC